MSISRLAAALFAACITPGALAAPTPEQQAPKPHQRTTLPPSADEVKFDLAPTRKPRLDLVPRNRAIASRALSKSADCSDMNRMAGYSGAALADYVATLPDYECTYKLFSLAPALASTIYAPSNLNEVVRRFTLEANRYDASNLALVNLALYLRAGFYLTGNDVLPAFSPDVVAALRGPIWNLIQGNALWTQNASAASTAGETIRLITNMHDEPYFLPAMKTVVQRFTNTAAHPNAAAALQQSSAAGGFTSALTVIYYAHFRDASQTTVRTDASYAATLQAFIVNDKAALLGTSAAYQLNDAASEAYRFLQYPGLVGQVRPLIQQTLATSGITGPDSDLWLAAASAVDYYDKSNCSLYGTCDYKNKLAARVLPISYTCSPTVRMRAQEMTAAQLQATCDALAAEETYAHAMLKTHSTPVAADNNTSLELVVFDDYANYQRYAGVLYGISTDNGGMYLEGDPADPNNQARFIAHEASWLRPEFKIWNLEHEYVHYIDGRFDMYGDFAAATTVPTVWWIEGAAEYLSLRNNNQKAIDAARTGAYRLSDIFGNTYGMSDYVNRAYSWGYMAVRFMNERHRTDIDQAIARFRLGDYNGYQGLMSMIGTSYDSEFASWVASATTAGEPPLPVDLKACSSTSQLGKNCAIGGLSSSTQSWLYILLPPGARNLKISTAGGSGEADLYVALDRYPGAGSYDYGSVHTGNGESVSIPAPVSGHWYYIMVRARTPFAGVTASATYE